MENIPQYGVWLEATSVTKTATAIRDSVRRIEKEGPVRSLAIGPDAELTRRLIKQQLDIAISKCQPRQNLPLRLNRFPFSLLRPFGRIFLKIYNYLTKEERERAASIIQAIVEIDRLNEALLSQMASIQSEALSSRKRGSAQEFDF